MLTDFGDLAILLPLAVAILLWLAASRFARGTALWSVALALCVGGTALLKIYFFACPFGRDVVSPSGHSSFSTLVYGGLAVIVAGELASGWRRALMLGAGTALVIAIAASRVVLGAHSVREVFLGLAVGLASLALFAGGYLRHRPPVLPLTPLLAAAVVLAVSLHGRELRAEELLHAISQYLRVGSIACG